MNISPNGSPAFKRFSYMKHSGDDQILKIDSHLESSSLHSTSFSGGLATWIVDPFNIGEDRARQEYDTRSTGCRPFQQIAPKNTSFSIDAILCSGTKGTTKVPQTELIRSNKSSVTKKKRIRTSFTEIQMKHLEKEFSQQQYIVGSHRLHLAMLLNLTEAQVKVWFQNRRIKNRKKV